MHTWASRHRFSYLTGPIIIQCWSCSAWVLSEENAPVYWSGQTLCSYRPLGSALFWLLLPSAQPTCQFVKKEQLSKECDVLCILEPGVCSILFTLQLYLKSTVVISANNANLIRILYSSLICQPHIHGYTILPRLPCSLPLCDGSRPWMGLIWKSIPWQAIRESNQSTAFLIAWAGISSTSPLAHSPVITLTIPGCDIIISICNCL